MVLGKFMKILLIALDVSLIAYIASHMIYHLLPITEAAFWVGVIVEIGLALLAFRIWMRARKVPTWNIEKTLVIALVLISIAWPMLARYSNLDFLIDAAPADLLFFWAALTLLIYSSFVIKTIPKTNRSKT